MSDMYVGMCGINVGRCQPAMRSLRLMGEALRAEAAMLRLSRMG